MRHVGVGVVDIAGADVGEMMEIVMLGGSDCAMCGALIEERVVRDVMKPNTSMFGIHSVEKSKVGRVKRLESLV
tara:strand:+ start:8014 stop:8235 length:222 start_codon:yes stop_codon:yes gene_type:complete